MTAWHSTLHNISYATLTCRSPIEMSPASPIEMSLGQAVVATFGVACDGGDPDERTGADAASCADRSVGQSADGRGGRHIDGSGSTPGLSSASRACCRWSGRAGCRATRPAEQSPARRDIPPNCSGLVREHYADFGPTLAAEKLAELHGCAISRRDLAAVDDRGRAVDRSPSSTALPAPAAPTARVPGRAGADRRIGARLVRGSRPRRARCWRSSTTRRAG